MATHVRERDVSTLDEAAVLADNFSLKHKYSSNKNVKGPNVGYCKGDGVKPKNIQATAVVSGYFKDNPKSGSSEKIKGTCYYCGKVGYQIKACWQKSRDQMSKPVAAVSISNGSSLKGTDVTNSQNSLLRVATKVVLESRTSLSHL